MLFAATKPCTMDGCTLAGLKKYQNFCSQEHLEEFSERKVPVRFDKQGTRVYFYDRNHYKENYEFSNFFPAEVIYNGISYRTSEHAFQAQKFQYPCATAKLQAQVDIIHDLILNADTPYEAFQIAKTNAILTRKDWNKVKEDVMYSILSDKFTRHDNLREKLSATLDARLVEDADQDYFWGRGDGTGLNKLGRILMQIRDEI